MLARGLESVFRGALFRAGYELFFTALPASEKEAAKSVIDVVVDRLGDATGGGLVRLALAVVPTAASPTILGLAACCAAASLLMARRLNGGYRAALERNLRRRAPGRPVPDDPTRRLMRRVARQHTPSLAAPPRATQAPPALDDDVRDILRLRSRNRPQIVAVLGRQCGIAPALVPHVIPLLAWNTVEDHALFALRKVAEEHVGQLLDALADPNQNYAVRRQLARVFSICVSERAATGLLVGLDDPRFEVRRQTARSLASIVDKNPRIHLDPERIFEVVLREVAVERAVWQSRRLLDEPGDQPAFAPFVRARASDSLAHVFTLLSLVLPREPLQLAVECLQADDPLLRGTALEYLEQVLPPGVRERLWPFLEPPPAHPPSGGRTRAIAELLRPHDSIQQRLDELGGDSAPPARCPRSGPPADPGAGAAGFSFARRVPRHRPSRPPGESADACSSPRPSPPRRPLGPRPPARAGHRRARRRRRHGRC